MNDTTTLQKRIMRRVWAIYVYRKATSPTALQTYVFSFLTWQLFMYVSMPSVVANMPSAMTPIVFTEFYFNSFVNTEFWVQIIAVGLMSLGIWFVRNTIRNMTQAQRRPRIAPVRNGY